MLKTARTAALLSISLLMAGCNVLAEDNLTEQQLLQKAVALPQLSIEAPDLIAPGRGQYQWAGTTMWGRGDGVLFPNPDSGSKQYDPSQYWPGASETYYRFNWREIEPTQGNINWDLIESKINAAVAQGRRFSFRIMTMDSCCGDQTTDQGKAIPDYVVNAGASKTDIRIIKDDQGNEKERYLTEIPDWNNPVYLDNFIRVLKAIGERYDGDDRINYVDMSGYGNWGEWHIASFEKYGDITSDNLKKLVDANLDAFKYTRLLSLTPNTEALAMAMQRPNVGIRMDCLGCALGGGAWDRMETVPASLTRWKTAPMVVEWNTNNYGEAKDILPTTSDALREEEMWASNGNNDSGDNLNEYLIGRRQVMSHHISLLSSGNFPYAWVGDKMKDAEWDDFSKANKYAGFRYTITQAAIPASVSGNQTMQVLTTWENQGVAPTYNPYKAEIHIMQGDKDVASVVSGINLKTLYADPSYDGDPRKAPRVATKTLTDKIKLPNLSSGNYDVVVKVMAGRATTNPNKTTPDMGAAFYATPLPLALAPSTIYNGKTNVYKIGSFSVK